MRKVTIFAAGAVLASLALAGCGAKQATSNNDGGGDSLQSLAAKLGASSSTKQGAHMTMSMEVAGQSIRADGDIRLGANPAMDLSYELPAIGSARIVLVDDTVYFQLPEQARKQTGGKPWVKVDPNGNDPLSKSLSGSLSEMKQNSDPSQLLTRIEGAGEITAKTQESLNGKQTTHYSVTVDVKKYAEKVNPELRSVLQKAIDAGVTSYPIELWLDQENLPVRATVSTPFTNPATQKPDSVKLSIDYADWGKAVTVTAPPADQVGPFPGR